MGRVEGKHQCGVACVGESGSWLGFQRSLSPSTMVTYWEKVTSSKGLKGDAPGRQVFAQAVLSWTCQLTPGVFSPFQS